MRTVGMSLSIGKIKLFTEILMCMIFFKPLAINSMSEYQSINQLWDYFRVALCIVLLFRLIAVKRKISKMLLLVILSQILFLFSTFYNDGDIRGMIVQMSSVIGFCILIELESSVNIKRLFTAMFFALSILVMIHTWFMVFRPEGFGYDKLFYNKVYFLASKNGLAKFFFPLMVSGLVIGELGGENKKTNVFVRFMIIICLLNSFVVQSLTTLIGMISCLGVYYLGKINLKKIEINIGKIALITILTGVLVSVISFTGAFNEIVAYVVDVEKYHNYLARVEIWRRVLRLIEDSWLIGYGAPLRGGHINVNGRFMNSHNGFLEFCLYGGAIGFVLCIALLFRCVTLKKKEISFSASDVVLCGVIGFMVMMIAESHISTIAYWGFMVMVEQLHLNEKKKDLAINENI